MNYPKTKWEGQKSRQEQVRDYDHDTPPSLENEVYTSPQTKYPN